MALQTSRVEPTSTERPPAGIGPEPRPAHSFPQCRCCSLQRTSLSNILTAADVNEVNTIVALLTRLQRRSGLKTRFHLLVESDVTYSSPLTSMPQQQIAERNQEYAVDTITEVLFSPTISFQIKNIQHGKQVEHLMLSINDMSRTSMSRLSCMEPRGDCSEINPTAHLRDVRFFPTTENQESFRGRDLERLSVEKFEVPSWFPFPESEYKTGLQVSANEILHIDPTIARKFDGLPNEDISNLYRSFFEYMHLQTKKKRSSYKQGKFKYAMFTPPWLRRKLSVEGNVSILPKVAVQDQRVQRNRAGFRRMAWTLAAFYEKEVCFGRYVLDYLLELLPDLREIWADNKKKNVSTAFTTVARRLDNRKFAKTRRRHAGSDDNQDARRLITTETENEILPVSSLPARATEGGDGEDNSNILDLRNASGGRETAERNGSGKMQDQGDQPSDQRVSNARQLCDASLEPRSPAFRENNETFTPSQTPLSDPDFAESQLRVLNPSVQVSNVSQPDHASNLRAPQPTSLTSNEMNQTAGSIQIRKSRVASEARKGTANRGIVVDGGVSVDSSDNDIHRKRRARNQSRRQLAKVNSRKKMKLGSGNSGSANKGNSEPASDVAANP